MSKHEYTDAAYAIVALFVATLILAGLWGLLGFCVGVAVRVYHMVVA